MLSHHSQRLFSRLARQVFWSSHLPFLPRESLQVFIMNPLSCSLMLQLSTLVLAEQKHGKLQPNTLPAVTAARALLAPVTVLVAGQDVIQAAQAAAGIEGVDKVREGAKGRHPCRRGEAHRSATHWP
jgi:hypothetical protein